MKKQTGRESDNLLFDRNKLSNAKLCYICQSLKTVEESHIHKLTQTVRCMTGRKIIVRLRTEMLQTQLHNDINKYGVRVILLFRYPHNRKLILPKTI